MKSIFVDISAIISAIVSAGNEEEDVGNEEDDRGCEHVGHF